jgi:hypothetical protein
MEKKKSWYPIVMRRAIAKYVIVKDMNFCYLEIYCSCEYIDDSATLQYDKIT